MVLVVVVVVVVGGGGGGEEAICTWTFSTKRFNFDYVNVVHDG